MRQQIEPTPDALKAAGLSMTQESDLATLKHDDHGEFRAYVVDGKLDLWPGRSARHKQLAGLLGAS